YKDSNENIIIKNGINTATLKAAYNNFYFKKYLIETVQLYKYITPLVAGNTSFAGFTSWFRSYDFAATIDAFNGSGSISNNETKLVDGVLRHRISWEEALGDPQVNYTINGQSVPTHLAYIFGNNLSLGPINIA
ncbi:hypothetical protein EBZ38_15860, partial [bacterium]|nr:hypothetical protein [bacterium]